MKSKLKFIEGIVSLTIILIILIYSKIISIHIKNGLHICMDILIPSMFIFLVISDFCQKTGILNLILKPFSYICGKLFKLDYSLGPIMLFSLICGYPAGIHLISTLVSKNKIDKKTATRMLYFCVNSGPAFLIGGISIPIFNNIIPGIILFISQIITFFIIGALCSIKATQKKVSLIATESQKINAFILSIKSAVHSMIIICSFTLFFSGIIGIIMELNIFNIKPNKHLSALFIGLIEVTNGVMYCKQINGPSIFFILSIITSFGGLCVHFQLKSIASKANISFGNFYLWRILYCFISTNISCYLFSKTKIPIDVFANSISTNTNISTQNPISSLSLIVLSIALLCCDKKIDIMKKSFKRIK